MKAKKFFIAITSILFLSTLIFPASKKPVVLTDEEAEYAELVTEISKVGEPYLKDNFVIFTAPRTARYVAIAFEHEDFKEVHAFKMKKVYNYEDEEIGSFYFYILKLPKTLSQVNYRLIIDGLWTTDPQNPNKIYDYDSDLYLSNFNAERNIPEITENRNDGTAHFVYKGATGQTIRVGGSFTNWDSWIYEMKEVRPGVYELDLPLLPGKYEYAFYTGIVSFPDATNPVKVYTPDGKVASLLVIE